MASKVYQIITDTIVRMIEETGELPWSKPWTMAGVGHQNGITHRVYRGLNPFILETSMQDGEYDTPLWVTYKQAQENGGQVRKGEKSTIIVYWKFAEEKDDDGEKTGNRYGYPMYHRVFNVEQCDWEDGKKPELEGEPDNTFTPSQKANQIVANMPKRPNIKAGSEAFYTPRQDTVTVPRPAAFGKSEEFYSTLFHELAHSTGHKERLNRFDPAVVDQFQFGSASYSKEELVAEMGAAFLCAVCGIVPKVIDNSAAYIKGWLKVFKNDSKILLQAAGQAQRVADYIQGISWNDDGEMIGIEGEQGSVNVPGFTPDEAVAEVEPEKVEAAAEVEPEKVEGQPSTEPESEPEIIAVPQQTGKQKELSKSVQNLVNRLGNKAKDERLKSIIVRNGYNIATNGHTVVMMWPTPEKKNSDSAGIFDCVVDDDKRGLFTIAELSRYHLEMAVNQCNAITKGTDHNTMGVSMNGTAVLSSRQGENNTSCNLKHGDGWMKKNQANRVPVYYQKRGKDLDFKINGKFMKDVITFLESDSIAIGARESDGAIYFYAPNGRKAIVMAMSKEA